MNVRRKLLKILAFSCVVGAVSLLGATAFARDRDGTKLQARSLEPGEAHEDTLTPPQDRADWFYVKVDASGTLRLRLTAANPINVTIYNSSSERKWHSSNTSGTITTSLAVEAGIYFIEITAPETTSSQGTRISYKLHVQI